MPDYGVKFIIPSIVRIGAMNYEVQEVPVILLNNRECYGAIDPEELKIGIKQALSYQRKRETFVHEVLHGIFMEAGYEEHKEEMVERLSRVLNQVLCDNCFYVEVPRINTDGELIPLSPPLADCIASEKCIGFDTKEGDE